MGVVNRNTGQVQFIPLREHKLLRLCYGMLDANGVMFSNEDRERLKELEKAGMVEAFDESIPVRDDQLYREYDNRFIASVHWSVTGGCNARCRHCYMSAPHAAWGEFSHEKCMDIIDQMAECGIHKVSLTGGEALIRKDFFDIVDRLCEKGIVITTLMSNGLLVNEGLLDKLEARGVKPEINMSFDGIGCHDWLRNVKGAEERVLNAFRLCKERGFPTGAEYCLHKGNMHAFRESMKLLDSLGCQSMKVNRLSLEGEAKGIADYAITCEEEYEFYLDYIPHVFEDGISMQIMLSGMFMGSSTCKPVISQCRLPEDKPHDNYAICGHARNVMHITADGMIVPCTPMGMDSVRSMFPNIGQMTLKEALSDSGYMEFINTRLKDYFEKQPGCASCEYRNRCAGGCRGKAAISGGIWERDMDSCHFFKGGYYERAKALIDGYAAGFTGRKGNE